eukprot:403348801
MQSAKDTQAQQRTGQAGFESQNQPLFSKDYEQQNEDLNRQMKMNESYKSSQMQQLGQQNISNELVHDSDQKSINIHDSKQTINEKDIIQKSSQAFGYGSNPLQSKEGQSNQPIQGTSSTKDMKSNASKITGKRIPVREITIGQLQTDKRKNRGDMNEQIGHDRQLNLNPEDTHEQQQIYAKDSRKGWDSNINKGLSSQKQEDINEREADSKLDLQKVNQQQMSGTNKEASSSEAPRGTFGNSVDWSNFEFKEEEDTYEEPSQSQDQQQLQQQQNIQGYNTEAFNQRPTTDSQLQSSKTQLDKEEQRRFPAPSSEKIDQKRIDELNRKQQEQKMLNQQDMDQKAQELGQFDIANQEPLLDQAQPDQAPEDTEWKLIDKLKFAMYNKIYKMFAEEQKDLKEDEEFDDEVEYEDKGLVQEARNIEEKKEASAFDEQQQKFDESAKLRKRSSRGQELMRRFQCAIKKKLQEMRKDFDEDKGIIFTDEKQKDQEQKSRSYQQALLPRRKLFKDEETHQRSKSPERILKQNQDMIKNKDTLISQNVPEQKSRPIHREKLQQKDVGKTLIGQTMPQVKTQQQKQQQRQMLKTSKKRGRDEFEKDNEYDQIGRWRYQKDRSHIDDGFQEGDLECFFDESNVLEKIDVPQQQQKMKMKQEPRFIEDKEKTFRFKQDIDEYAEQNGWRYQVDRSNIDDGFEQGDLERLFDETRFWKDYAKIQNKKEQEVLRSSKMRQQKPQRLPRQQKKHLSWYNSDANYDVINGWRFQKDRSKIFDGFKQGDLACLFDDSKFWESMNKGQYQRRKQKKIDYKQYQKKANDKNYDITNGWKFQIDRSNIFDGFEEGDLPRLFDESQVVDTIETKQMKKQSQEQENYDEINGWRFQKDRSNIFDGFEEGDLPRLFDESQVQEKIIPWSEMKKQKKEQEYNEINGWRFQKDRSHISDGFEAGDLSRLFREESYGIKDTKKRSFDVAKQRQAKKVKESYDEINGWKFQVDRSRIDDGFQQGDLDRLFDDSSFWSRSTSGYTDFGNEKPPNELDYQEELKALQKKRQIRRRKRSDKLKMQAEPSPDEMQRRSISGYDIFGDPMNLSHKTMCTSEDHLIITPQVKLGKMFQKVQDIVPPKLSQADRQLQSQRDKEAARQKKLQEEQQQRMALEEKMAKKMSQNQKVQGKKGQKLGVVQEAPKLTLNQKKKIKRKERKLRQYKDVQHTQLWESLENVQISSVQDISFNEIQILHEDRGDFVIRQQNMQFIIMQ